MPHCFAFDRHQSSRRSRIREKGSRLIGDCSQVKCLIVRARNREIADEGDFASVIDAFACRLHQGPGGLSAADANSNHQ